MSKNTITVILSILGGIAAIGVLIFTIYSCGSGDREIVRSFMIHLSTGEIAEAHALLHPSVAADLTLAQLTNMADNMEAYTDVGFSSFSFSNANGTRTSELSGSGVTATGCDSTIEFHLLNGRITFFDVSPLCRRTGVDA